jgi:hypothetical protein
MKCVVVEVFAVQISSYCRVVTHVLRDHASSVARVSELEFALYQAFPLSLEMN